MSIELKNVTYTYSPGTSYQIHALKDINLEIPDGQFIGVIGHTGSGKSTLIQHFNALIQPTSGTVSYNGEDVWAEKYDRRKLRSEVGLVFQYPEHQLFESDVLSDVCFGPMNQGMTREQAEEEARKALHHVGFKEENFDKSPFELSGGQKKRVAIAGVLAMNPKILILDEPTAVLTPQETARLFEVIRNMKADNKSVIIITHKLHEVLEISDRVAILRKGEYIGTVDTCEATENSLTEMMVGKKVELNIARSAPVNPVKRLSVSHLTVYNREDIKVLDDVSFDVYGGEILGIAGISGNGQKELLEAIAGLQITGQGSSIEFYERGKENQPLQLVGKTPKKIRDAGVHLAFVPEDRLGMGLVGSMGMTGNMLLKSYGKGASPLTDMRTPKKMAEKVKEELEVVTQSLNTPVSRLSGGNVQKVLVGREIAEAPTVLMTAYAVRGLDINTSYTIYNLLDEEKKEGVAVVYVGEDLDVLIDLCDRILVLCGGKENGILDARTTTKEEVGLLMTNLRKEGK